MKQSNLQLCVSNLIGICVISRLHAISLRIGSGEQGQRACPIILTTSNAATGQHSDELTSRHSTLLHVEYMAHMPTCLMQKANLRCARRASSGLLACARHNEFDTQCLLAPAPLVAQCAGGFGMCPCDRKHPAPSPSLPCHTCSANGRPSRRQGVPLPSCSSTAFWPSNVCSHGAMD